VIDITQNDEEDRLAGRDGFVEFMFENGYTFKIFCADPKAYKSGFPFCYTTPDENDGLYHPSAEDAAKGKWAVVEQHSADGTIDHIIPCRGKLHEFDKDCFCKPKKGFRDDGSYFFTHEEVAEDGHTPS
jgi:hypothetical protein